MKELLYREDSEFSEGYVYSEYRSDKPLKHNQNINAPEEIALLVGKTITKAEYLISDSFWWNWTGIQDIHIKRPWNEL